MQICILGLGGGGMRVATEYMKWLESFTPQDQPDDKNELPTGWLFTKAVDSEQPGGDLRVVSSFGFAMVDSASGDLDIVRRNNVPGRIVKVVSDEDGFAGDSDKAFHAITHTQAPLEEPWRKYKQERNQNPTVSPHVRYRGKPVKPDLVPLVAQLGDEEELSLSTSDAVVACTSLLGGSGRGSLDYINKRWDDIFEKGRDTLKLLVGVVPPTTELRSQEVRDRVRTYINTLNSWVQGGPDSDSSVSGVVLIHFNLAQAIFNATRNSSHYAEYRRNRMDINGAVEASDKNAYRASIANLPNLQTYPALGTDELPPDTAVDAGAVMATAPLFTNAAGLLLKDRRGSPAIRIPKYLDANDLRGDFGNSFIIPCYAESRLTPGPAMLEHWERYKSYYRDRGVPEYILNDPVLYSLAMICDTAINLGSFLPVSQDHVTQKTTKAFYVVWASPGLGLSYDHISYLSDFLSGMYGIENSRAYLQSGSDIINKYVSTRFLAPNSDVVIRMWVYLCTDDSEIANNALNLMT